MLLALCYIVRPCCGSDCCSWVKVNVGAETVRCTEHVRVVWNLLAVFYRHFRSSKLYVYWWFILLAPLDTTYTGLTAYEILFAGEFGVHFVTNDCDNTGIV